MSLGEVAYRARQEAAKIVERTWPPPRTPAETVEVFKRRVPEFADPASALERFRSLVQHRFFAGATTPKALQVLMHASPESCAAIVAAAARVTRRRFDLLGYSQLSFGEPVDWHRDPVSGCRAPEIHWSRIDPLDPAVVGDSKVTWELGRCQWLITLAQAHHFTGDARYVRAAAELFDGWVEANPPGIGIHWTSSLELAYRAIAWSWALVLFRDTPFLTPERFAMASAELWMHGRHIERYLSQYFSPNTHLTGEALGLVYLSVLFPEFPEAQRWRELGRRVLVAEADRQILPDGVYFEQASAYQRYTIDIYLHFLVLAAINSIPVPSTVSVRVERMLEVLQAIRWPDGSLADFGDADGGWLLPLVHRGPRDCRGTLAVGAVVSGRSDFAWGVDEVAPELVWLFGDTGVRQFERIGVRPPDDASRAFSAGGLVVMRSGWERDAHQLLVDAGPLGCPMSSAHGHADLLSLQCAVFGEEHLIDPGTFCYTPQPAWRNFFRSTAAHSTVEIDGVSQAEPTGPFSWSAKPVARVREWQSTPELDFVDAEHAAYGHLADPVRHRRRVLFVKPHYWVVVDDLLGAAEHRIDVRFQFAPRSVTVGTAPWVRSEGRAGALWVGAFAGHALDLSIRQAELHPIEGWMSSNYGRRRPSPVAVYSATAALPARIVTLLMPVDRLDGPAPRVDVRRDESGRLIGLWIADRREALHVSDDVVRVEWNDFGS